LTPMEFRRMTGVLHDLETIQLAEEAMPIRA
jgi:hypothetical protein